MKLNLAKYNRHWKKGFFYPYPKKRNIFDRIKKSLNKRQILQIVGLRRVGKSTLIFQLINYLKNKAINPYHLLYFTFDEKQPSIEDILDTFTQQTGVDYKSETIVVFLDEVQKLNNFQNQIKVYYDLYPNIKFIISGSTSLFIKKKSQESLAGRILSFFVSPLSFSEYLKFIDKQELIEKPAVYFRELENEFKKFLYSQFIEAIGLRSLDEKKEYFRSITKKIIFEDLPFVFNFDNPNILHQIVQYIAQYPGAIINNLHLAQELKISNKTVALYLSYLEESFLIKKLYNFSKNRVTSERKLKKYYLASPSLSISFVDFLDESKLFENYVISVNDFKYFFRDSFGHEVDFINVENNQLQAIEVKFKDNILPKDLKNLFIFNKRYSVEENILYCKVAGSMKVKGLEIKLKPFYLV